MADDETNIVRLASVNNTVETKGEAARLLIAAFLREWAEAFENGTEEAGKAILIIHDDRPGELFRIRTRRCNADLVQTVGIMQLAMTDLCTATE